jgi:hypothetical protein
MSRCVQKAYDTSIIFPDSFESEMLQLCVDYLKKSFETSEVEIMSSKCPTIIVFIGKLFNMEAISNDAIRGFLSFLSNRDSKPLYNSLISVIHDKILEDSDDEVLKSFIPEGFKHERVEYEELESDKEENEQNGTTENGGGGSGDHVSDEQQGPLSSSSSSATTTPQFTPKHMPKTVLPAESSSLVVTTMTENVSDPIDKFKEQLHKLSPTNGAHILRETYKIRLGCGEEIVKKLALAIVEHAINKQTLIKSIVEIAVKLHETIVPHFSASLMRKHLRAIISSKIFKCSERESTGYCQLVSELHKSNFYDRFDVIILLESFSDNFNSDRTALPSLLKFTNELEEVISSKKLSKNMRIKLMNIAQILAPKLDEEIHADIKDGIEHALKILKGETMGQRDKLKREDSSDDYLEVSDYRYDGTAEEYVIRFVFVYDS